MSLKDWAASGWLKEHRTSSQEIRNLLALADRDLADCTLAGLSSDWRLAIAYNAALQLATAALAARGFRAAREAHHYRIVQSLAFTAGFSKDVVDTLDSFRRKRNLSEYERAGAVSEKEAGEMMALASEVRVSVHGWLAVEYPELL